MTENRQRLEPYVFPPRHANARGNHIHHRHDDPELVCLACALYGKDDELREVKAALSAEAAPAPKDGIRFDAESNTWIARYTVLTAGTTEAEAKLALAEAVRLVADHWPGT